MIIKNISELSNREVQDILEDMDMLNDNGNCPHTAEEMFRAGIEYAFNVLLKWLKDNIDINKTNTKESCN